MKQNFLENSENISQLITTEHNRGNEDVSEFQNKFTAHNFQDF